MVALGFVIVAAVLKAAQDSLAHHFSESVFSQSTGTFWNPAISWRNKWKLGNPANGEKFFLSSTVLVSLTDGWHLMQLGFLTLMFSAIVFYQPTFSWWIDLIILRVAFGCVFEALYAKLFRL